MFKHILIAVDGRTGGQQAIALARALSVCCPDADFALGHVFVAPPLSAHRPKPEVPPGIAAIALLTAERERSGIDAELFWCEASTVADGFSQLIRETDADLLVLGSSHRGAAARVLLGDTCRRTLELKDVAVAVAPKGYVANTPLRAIGVAHDGSVEAAEAFVLAERLRGAAGARLLCATVISPWSVPDGQPLDAGVDRLVGETFSDEELRAIADERIETYAGSGVMGPQLAAFSQQVDLLVVGAPGRRLSQHLPFGGSTDAYLASRCACPLLITAPSAAARPTVISTVADRLQQPQPVR